MTGRHHQQRMPIRWRLGHDVGADHSASTGAVVDQRLLAPDHGVTLADHAGENIVRTTWGERHDDTNRLGGKRLRHNTAGKQATAQQER